MATPRRRIGGDAHGPTAEGAADPVGWLEMLDRLRKLNPAGLVASRGEPTKLVFQELEGIQIMVVETTAVEEEAQVILEALFLLIFAPSYLALQHVLLWQ